MVSGHGLEEESGGLLTPFKHVLRQARSGGTHPRGATCASFFSVKGGGRLRRMAVDRMVNRDSNSSKVFVFVVASSIHAFASYAYLCKLCISVVYNYHHCGFVPHHIG